MVSTVVGAIVIYFGAAFVHSFTGYKRAEGPNIIIISFDAMRRDYVSAYNTDHVSTPNIDYVAEKGYKFENSFSNSPWTLPSLMTMNSGQYPSVHGIHKKKMPADVPTLAVLLKRRGYRTEAYIGNEILRPGYDFDKGFDRFEVFNDIVYLRPVKNTSVGRVIAITRKRLNRPAVSGNYENTTRWCTEKALKRIEHLHDGPPYFLWIHYLDPHTPLTPPKKYIAGDSSRQDEIYEFAVVNTYTGNMANYKKEDKEKLVALYSAEVRYADDSFGEIVNKFD
ncbi:MAG: sulfatase-like hydrolase/transferase, partial [bacterium]|nr:sulfatase-like hydrolase/transferase [bacterium]